jgi:hypothetical protein
MRAMTTKATMVLVALCASACAGDDKRPATSADGASEEAGDAPAEKTATDASEGDAPLGSNGLPSKCARQDAEVCLPPDKFVNALCNHDYPTVALSLFLGGTPWTRAYMLAETKAVYASGGGSSNDMLRVDEEVLVLRKRTASQPGGMTVSGADGSYDILRWDGACATVHPSELSFQAPSKVKNARIIWSNLEVAAREKLKENTTVYDAYVTHKRSCKGVTFGDVTKDCVKADEDLSRTVAEQVRTGGSLPNPKKLPEL